MKRWKTEPHAPGPWTVCRFPSPMMLIIQFPWQIIQLSPWWCYFWLCKVRGETFSYTAIRLSSYEHLNPTHDQNEIGLQWWRLSSQKLLVSSWRSPPSWFQSQSTAHAHHAWFFILVLLYILFLAIVVILIVIKFQRILSINLFFERLNFFLWTQLLTCVLRDSDTNNVLSHPVVLLANVLLLNSRKPLSSQKIGTNFK